MALDTWLFFLLTTSVTSLAPGAGAISSMAAGLNFGFRHGYWNAVGLQLALIIQVAIVAAGLGALLATSAWLFATVKWLGVFYLLYLGYKQWTTPVDTHLPQRVAMQRTSPQALLLRGFLINSSNPKAILFILAIMPQFIDTHHNLATQYLFISATMIIVDLIVMAAYTALAAKVLRLLRNPAQQYWLNRTFGGLFMIAAAILASAL
ncbi:MAG: LysE family transporter [Gammaproteobacteria bacterium]|nr:LysE family transporter [Gammaproteobacteria bacterium]